MRAADAWRVVRALPILGGDRVAAGVALVVVALAEIVAHGHAVVEDEAVALPLAFILRHLFQVLEDAALEVEDLLEALAEHVAGGLFATDAAGAEHGDLLVPGRVVMGLDVLGELAERLGLGIDGALEGADGHFVVVARIDQQHLGVGDQGVPVLGLDVGADALVGVHARHAEGDDFLLQLDLGAVEGLLVAVGLLVVDIGQARVALEPGQQAVDALARGGNGAVDAFLGEQQGALHAAFEHGVEQGLAQRFVIRQGHELVQRRDNNLRSHAVFSSGHPRKGRTGALNKSAGLSRRGARF